MLHFIILALAPVFAVILFIYFKDKYEKEPTQLLIGMFLFGAVISIIIATILYYVSNIVIPLDSSSVFQQFIKVFFIVGLIEEFSKYVGVRYVAQPKKAFNEPFDGIVYAVMVSMGFAATENILYVLDGGVETAIWRAFTAIPAHASFGVLMGYFMGKSKFHKNKKTLNLLGLALAIFFHGAYDFFLFINFIPGVWIGAIVSLITAIILALKAIKIHQNASVFKNN